MSHRKQSRTPVEIRTAPLSAPALVTDLQEGADAAAPFYGGHPFDPAAYERKAAAVAARLDATARRRVADAFRPTSDAGASRLARVLDGTGFFVTTGQQAGLFGGPLYTVVKILCAIRLASALEDLLGVPVVALFWVAADDHDWPEVNHTALVDASNELRRITLVQPEDAPPVAMADRRLGPGIADALQALEAALPQSEFAGPLMDCLRPAYHPDASMADAFEALIAMLFAEQPLVLVSSAHPAVRATAQPLLMRDAQHVEHFAALLARTTDRLLERGYHAQVSIASDAANLFFHDEHGRDRLVREDGTWHLRRSKRRFSADELMARLQTEPTRFSPNVLLRPVIESALFPTLAYVGGPAELSYLAQVSCLFAEHGIEAPIAYPRTSVTILEGRVRRVLDKFGLDVQDFHRPFHEVAARVLRAEMPHSVTEATAALRAAIAPGYDRLADAAAEIDPTLRKWVQGVRNGALGNVDDAEKKIASHYRKRHEVEEEQLRKAAINLYPDGTLQERVLSPLQFLARYGLGLLDDVLEALETPWSERRPAWEGPRCED